MSTSDPALTRTETADATSHDSPVRMPTAGTLPRKHQGKTPADSALYLLGTGACPVAHSLLGRPPLTRSPPPHSTAPRLLGCPNLPGLPPPPLAPQQTTGGRPHILHEESQPTRDEGEKEKIPIAQKSYRVGTLTAGPPRRHPTRGCHVGWHLAERYDA